MSDCLGNEGDRPRRVMPRKPRQGGQVEDVVGMKMAYCDYRQVAKLCLGLSEAKECPAAHVDKNLRLGADPKQVTG